MSCFVALNKSHEKWKFEYILYMEEESSQVRLKKDQEKKMSVLLQVKEEKDTLKV